MESTKMHVDGRTCKRPRLRLRHAWQPSSKRNHRPSLRSMSSLTPSLQTCKILHKYPLAPTMNNTFHGPIDAQVAIPAPQCGPGGTMNFNFGSGKTDGTLESHPQIAA
jgi:hypothetical protein